MDESNVLYSDPNSPTSQSIPHQAGILQVSCRCYKKYFTHKVGYKIVFDDKDTENVKNIVYILTWINWNL